MSRVFTARTSIHRRTACGTAGRRRRRRRNKRRSSQTSSQAWWDASTSLDPASSQARPRTWPTAMVRQCRLWHCTTLAALKYHWHQGDAQPFSFRRPIPMFHISKQLNSCIGKMQLPWDLSHITLCTCSASLWIQIRVIWYFFCNFIFVYWFGSWSLRSSLTCFNKTFDKYIQVAKLLNPNQTLG